jgi:hypothetical protein
MAGLGGHLRLTVLAEKDREVNTVQVSGIQISSARLWPDMPVAKPEI